MRWLVDGVEGADSLTWNPHKWLGTVLDCSLLYVADPAHLIRVMSTNPSYLRSAVDGEVTQYKDWGIPLGRRFRALKLWFHLRLDGVEAIRARLRRDLDNARWLAEQVDAAPGWRVLAPVSLQTVVLRHEPADLDTDGLNAHTLAWVDAVNISGAALVTPSLLDGVWSVRVSIGAERTERSDVEHLWRLLQHAATNAERGGAAERAGQRAAAEPGVQAGHGRDPVRLLVGRADGVGAQVDEADRQPVEQDGGYQGGEAPGQGHQHERGPGAGEADHQDRAAADAVGKRPAGEQGHQAARGGDSDRGTEPRGIEAQAGRQRRELDGPDADVEAEQAEQAGSERVMRTANACEQRTDSERDRRN